MKKRTEFEELMGNKLRFKAYPMHLVYAEIDAEYGLSPKFAFSAPKRIHRLAVHRNLIKRRMRAAVRPLIPQIVASVETSGTAYAMMFIYVGAEIVDLTEIEERISHLVDRFIERNKTDR